MAIAMQQRRDTAANWTSTNPTPLQGQICFVIDVSGEVTNMKIGDGTTAWTSLPYFATSSSGLLYQGTWNATTNTPALASGTGTGGHYYIVSVSGSTDLDGVTDWVVGDWAIFNEGNNTWQKIDQSNTVASVFGRVGAVVSAVGDYDLSQIAYPTANKIGDPTNIDTLQELFNHEYSAGVMHGCDITDNGDGTVSFGTGVAMLRASSDPHTTLYAISVAAQSNLSLTDNATNYVYLDYNAGSPQFVVSTSITSFNCLDKCIAYMIFRESTSLKIIDAREQNVDGNRKSRRLFLNIQKFIHHAGGSTLGTPGLLYLSVTSGAFNFMLGELPHDAFDTSVAGTNYKNVFTYYYNNGAGGWTKVTDRKSINNTQYDNGTGTLATLGNGNYRTDWVYLIHDSPTTLAVQVGSNNSGSIANARAVTIPTPPPILSSMGSLIGKVIVQKNAAAIAETYTSFDTVFTGSAATEHNRLAGLQGGTTNEYYHLTSAEHTGTGTGTFVRQTSPSLTTPTIAQINGSTASGGDLTLQSTTGATKGNINFGTSTYDEVNNRLGIGTTTPSTTLDVTGTTHVLSTSATAKGLTLENNVATGYAQLQWTGTGNSYTIGVGNASETLLGVANKFFVYDLTNDTVRLTINSSGVVNISNAPTYADDSAAGSGGLVAGDVYKTSDGSGGYYLKIKA